MKLHLVSTADVGRVEEYEFEIGFALPDVGDYITVNDKPHEVFKRVFSFADNAVALFCTPLDDPAAAELIPWPTSTATQ